MTSVWNLRQQWPFDYISTHLTPQIITGEGNSVFHSEWDNLNRITTNVHGSNVVNSTKGIMIQEVKESHVSTKKRTLPLYDRSSKMRSRKIKPPEMLPELAFKRAGPNFPNNANFTSPAENQESYGASMLQYNTHLLCRLLSSQGKHTGKVPPRKSTIDFYTPINQPITDNAVVYEILKRSEAATEEVGQPYTINTFDLGVVMKACPIVWKNEEEFTPCWDSVFTGEDYTSAFKGKGKVNPLKKLQQNPKLHNAFRQLGADWLVPDELHCEMESFTCIMYGQARMTSVDAVRAKMLRKMVGADKVLDSKSKVDLERLPPPKVCLIPHVLAQRAESEEQAALDMLADSNNSNNLSVGEEDEEYYHNDEDEVLEEIDLEDLFSDDEEDE
ncbi:unnamed protein product [Leuciscus chuanchicus]